MATQPYNSGLLSLQSVSSVTRYIDHSHPLHMLSIKIILFYQISESYPLSSYPLLCILLSNCSNLSVPTCLSPPLKVHLNLAEKEIPSQQPVLPLSRNKCCYAEYSCGFLCLFCHSFSSTRVKKDINLSSN